MRTYSFHRSERTVYLLHFEYFNETASSAQRTIVSWHRKNYIHSNDSFHTAKQKRQRGWKQFPHMNQPNRWDKDMKTFLPRRRNQDTFATILLTHFQIHEIFPSCRRYNMWKQKPKYVLAYHSDMVYGGWESLMGECIARMTSDRLKVVRFACC